MIGIDLTEITAIWNLRDWILSLSEYSIPVVALLWIGFTLLLVFSVYFFGGVNFTPLVAKIFYKENPKKANGEWVEVSDLFVLHGWIPFWVAGFLDVLKGFVAVWYGRILFGVDGGALAGFFVCFGALYPFFRHFKGSKSIATLFGVAFALNPITAVLMLLIFLVVTIGTRYLCLGVMMTAFLYPLLLEAFANSGLNVAMAVFTTLAVILSLKKNLKALRQNEEPKTELLSYLKTLKKGKNDKQ